MKALLTALRLCLALCLPSAACALPQGPTSQSVGLLAENMQVYILGHIGFHAPSVQAWLTSTVPGAPVGFDHLDQLSIAITGGEVILDTKQLESLFNTHILAYSGTMLRDFRMHPAKDRLDVEGEVQIMGVGPWLPLKLSGTIVLSTDQQKIEYRPDSLQVLGIPSYSLIGLVGLSMSSLVTLDRPGAVLEGNNLILDYHKVFPEIHIQGLADNTWLTPEGLHIHFQRAPDGPPPPPFSLDRKGLGPRFMWLQFGQLDLHSILVDQPQVLILPEKPDEALIFRLQDYTTIMSTGVAQIKLNGRLLLRLPPFDLNRDQSDNTSHAH